MPACPHRRSLAALAAAALLAAPGTAYAQSAGDEQYSDPLAGEESPAQRQSPSGSGERRSAPPPAPAGAGQASQAPSTEAGRPRELAYTGMPAGLIAAIGVALAGMGVAARRRARR